MGLWADSSQPFLEAKDAWFRQCNFLASLDLLNFNLLDNQPVGKDRSGPFNATIESPTPQEYKAFNASQFEEDFREDHDGFLGMLKLI